MNAEDNQVNDEAVLAQILLHAKPTITLTTLKNYLSDMMDENDMRKSLGRLWRSVQVFRCPAGNQVVYWTAVTAKAAASSGLSPEMPPDVEVPEICKIAVGVKPSIEPKAQFSVTEVLDMSKVVAKTKEEKVVLNNLRSRGQLIPISQTAAQVMVPLETGTLGNIRRGSLPEKVATVMFKYRDVRLCIDAVTSLCKTISRVDVARILSQLSSGHSRQYFIRIKGETRFDATFTWNKEVSYPFAERFPTDGVEVPMKNVDKEAENDVKLDHVPASQLSEDETESEIARLLSPQLGQLRAEEPVVQESAEEVSQHVSLVSTPILENERHKEIGPIGEPGLLGPSGCPRGPAGPQGTVGIQGCGHSGTVNSIEEDGVLLPERRARLITVSDEKFKAGIFTTGEMVMHFDHSQLELTKDQTDRLIDLLGPVYMARKAA